MEQSTLTFNYSGDVKKPIQEIIDVLSKDDLTSEEQEQVTANLISLVTSPNPPEPESLLEIVSFIPDQIEDADLLKEFLNNLYSALFWTRPANCKLIGEAINGTLNEIFKNDLGSTFFNWFLPFILEDFTTCRPHVRSVLFNLIENCFMNSRKLICGIYADFWVYQGTQNRKWICTGKLLGSGSFGNVFEGLSSSTGERVALKLVTSETNPEKAKAEAEILKKLNHTNVLKLYDFITFPSIIYVMELCAGGELKNYVLANDNKPTKYLSECETFYWLYQLCKGLHYMVTHKIVHRDLKLANLLLTEKTKTGILKIADFGSARVVNQFNGMQTFTGTPMYMAPEVVNGKSYGVEVDLWSVGVIAYQMLTGVYPFGMGNTDFGASPIQQMEILKHKINSLSTLDWPKDIIISHQMKDLVERLLKVDPSQRMSWTELFSCFDSFKDLDEEKTEEKKLESKDESQIVQQLRQEKLELENCISEITKQTKREIEMFNKKVTDLQNQKSGDNENERLKKELAALKNLNQKEGSNDDIQKLQKANAELVQEIENMKKAFKKKEKELKHEKQKLVDEKKKTNRIATELSRRLSASSPNEILPPK